MNQVKCEDCGKEFEGDTIENANFKLNGHKRYCKGREEDRQERVPLHLQARSTGVPDKDDGFMYRTFNDNWKHDPDRIRKAQIAGWEIVDKDRASVGTNDDGTEIKGILMRIPKHFYDEDQADKQKQADLVDQQIHRGKFQENPGDNRYIPSSGIRIETKLTG